MTEQAQRRTAPSPHGDVSYITAGTGPALLLIHGTGGSAESNWAHLIPDLASRYHVIAPDLPGSGSTPLFSTPLALSTLVDTVLAAADAERVDQIRVVGFSLGAVIGAQLVSAHSHRIASALLIGGWAKPDPRLRVELELWQHLIVTDPESAATVLTLTGFSPAHLATLSETELRETIFQTSDTFPTGMVAQAELDTRVDISAAAQRIAVPTLVVGMQHDHMVPVPASRNLAQLIPGADYIELESGHLVIYELPQELTRLILDGVPA